VSDSRLQEIVTRAVVGRAERRVSWSHTVPAEGVTGVLGVHVSDSTVAIKEKNGRAVVDVLVDCDLWCGSSKSTKVLRQSIRHTDGIDIRTVGHVLGDRDMTCKMVGAARATGVTVADAKITVSFEADVVIEMSALARLWVKAFDLEENVLSDVDDPNDESESGSDSDSGFGE
jgi:hypothetical protein